MGMFLSSITENWGRARDTGGDRDDQDLGVLATEGGPGAGVQWPDGEQDRGVEEGPEAAAGGGRGAEPRTLAGQED